MTTNNEEITEEEVIEESNIPQMLKIFGIPLLLFIIGVGIGFVIWGRSGSVQGEVSYKDTFSDGWKAARQKLIDLGLYSDKEVYLLSGYVDSVDGDKIIISTALFNPLDDEALEQRIVHISSDTEVVLITKGKEVQAELSELMSGYAVAVEASEDIAQKKEFTAKKVAASFESLSGATFDTPSGADAPPPPPVNPVNNNQTSDNTPPPPPPPPVSGSSPSDTPPPPPSPVTGSSSDNTPPPPPPPPVSSTPSSDEPPPPPVN